jgi:hypothetical protein
MGVLAASWLALQVGERGASAQSGPPRDLPLFTISKSENRNQVQYAVRVGPTCEPQGAAPAFAYWRMVEKGPGRTEPLLPQEHDAYGIASQAITERGPDRWTERLVLKAVQHRQILVEVLRTETGECRALATVTIQGAPAHLFNVHAKLKWPLGVDYLLIQGWSLDGSRVVTERLTQ